MGISLRAEMVILPYNFRQTHSQHSASASILTHLILKKIRQLYSQFLEILETLVL